MALRFALLLAALLPLGCVRVTAPVLPLAESGKLVVATLNGPATWFEDAQERPAGFEHDLALAFAREAKAELFYLFVDSPAAAERALRDKRAHLAAALLPRHLDLPGGNTWGPSYRQAQNQLIWRAADPRPAQLKDLAGKRIGVIADSFADELLAKPAAVPGQLERLPADATAAELLRRLAAGELDAAILDSARFTIERKHFPQLEVAFPIGKPVDYAWRVGTVDQGRLLGLMKPFFERVARDGTLRRLEERWFGHAERITTVDASAFLERIETTLPPLLPQFVEAGRLTGVDWRLLAAIAYQESHWDPQATSPTGVRGLMMLTEETAQRMSVTDRLDPWQSIVGGAGYWLLLASQLPDRIPEPDRTFLALAAYNLGLGHLEDARILAQRRGLSPDKWEDVKLALPGLADPEVFRTLRLGFARGREALHFVDNVRNYRDMLDRLAPKGQLTPAKPAPAQRAAATGPGGR